MQNEFAPPPGRHRRPTKEEVQRLIKGGKIGEQIRDKREWHHDNYEVPEAEDFIGKELSSLKNNQQNKQLSGQIKNDRKQKKWSFWQYLIDLLKRIFRIKK